MSLLEMLLVGVALAMDAFAVTLSDAAAHPHERRVLWVLPVAFGVAQALMPALGYLAGSVAAALIERYAGILTLVVLGFIGANMVREGTAALMESGEGRDGGGSCPVEGAEGEGRDGRSSLTVRLIALQALATAIDAFAVGVSLRAQDADILLAALIIGLSTMAICAVALLVGRRVGELLGDGAEVAGGIVLIVIGIRAMVA